MQEITITRQDAGGRLDRLLERLMAKAPKSFFYKMLRKKNITLNGKKAQGNERLQSGDVVRIFFSDETYRKFGGVILKEHENKSASLIPMPDILYQDENIVLLNKPAGILSQKAKPGDLSLVDELNEYLLESGILSEQKMQTIHPALCSRLDRNTSGIVSAGISLCGLQEMNRIIRLRSLGKYYRCIVLGDVEKDALISGYLLKDEKTNKVRVSENFPGGNAKKIRTSYRVITHAKNLTLLEVHLITGRSHQIRAHLSSIGHPLLGDPKYGDPTINEKAKREFNVHYQMLHAYRIVFPKIDGALSYLSGREFVAPMPPQFDRLMRSGIK